MIEVWGLRFGSIANLYLEVELLSITENEITDPSLNYNVLLSPYFIVLFRDSKLQHGENEHFMMSWGADRDQTTSLVFAPPSEADNLSRVLMQMHERSKKALPLTDSKQQAFV